MIETFMGLKSAGAEYLQLPWTLISISESQPHWLILGICILLFCFWVGPCSMDIPSEACMVHGFQSFAYGPSGNPVSMYKSPKPRRTLGPSNICPLIANPPLWVCNIHCSVPHACLASLNPSCWQLLILHIIPSIMSNNNAIIFITTYLLAYLLLHATIHSPSSHVIKKIIL